MLGISVRILVDELAKRGQRVFIITASRVQGNEYMNLISVFQLPKIPQGFLRTVLTGPYSFYRAIDLFPKVHIVHYHWGAFFHHFPSMITSMFKTKKKKSIMTVRGGGLRLGLQNARMYSLTKKILKQVDRVVAISQGMYDLARMYHVSQRKLAIIPNAVDTQLFNPDANRLSIRKKFDIGDSPLVVSVGFEKIKGMEQLIKSIPNVLSEVSEARFIFIGTDEKRKIELQKLTRKLRVNQATFFVCPAPYYLMPNFIAAADVVATLFSSKVDKGQYVLPNEAGRVHLEAMACGTPVITSVAKELIENGRTGFRVSTDTHEIASAIVKILQDEKLREQMGKNARKLIIKHYSAEVMTERYSKLYEEVADL